MYLFSRSLASFLLGIASVSLEVVDLVLLNRGDVLAGEASSRNNCTEPDHVVAVLRDDNKPELVDFHFLLGCVHSYMRVGAKAIGLEPE